MSEVVKASQPIATVTISIDGVDVRAKPGELLIRVAEQLGIEIPRFCDHPLLEPAGACRQCLVEVDGQRKPVTACTQPVSDGMVVRTQRSSEVARKAQQGIMELLLINHPLDCPMCDKGGECPLQNQAMSTGRTESRFVEGKRTFAKPIHISSQVLLDRERCVLCQRCTRFSDEIAGDRFIDLMERSSGEQIGIDEDTPFNSYFSGNTVQICPVGALTGAQYRFRARPFDLVSVPSACEHCAAGCAQRTDHRRGAVTRRLAGDDPAVNEEWNCDRGRWGFRYATLPDRLTTPLVRDPRSGTLKEASWPHALRVAAAGLLRARDGATRHGGAGDGAAGDGVGEEGGRGVGVLTGGRLTVEDAYAYSKFARVALHTNDIDFRARLIGPANPTAAAAAAGEEAMFLAGCVAGRTVAGSESPAAVRYTDVDTAPVVVLVGLEPEDECPILFLRLRKAVRAGSLRVLAVAPVYSRGLAKLDATLIATVPGAEAQTLRDDPQLRAALQQDGAILFVGERLACVAGGLSAAAALPGETGVRLAWVPRRAGDRGGVETGCLPNVLPGARLVSDAPARTELARLWAVDPAVIPAEVGRDVNAILNAAASRRLGGLLVAGVDPGDLADPTLAIEALDAVDFLVSLEVRASAVTDRADVVLPVAPVVEKAGSFLSWEGRLRAFHTVLDTTAMPDARVLDALASEMGVALGCADVAAIRRELASLPASPTTAAAPTVAPIPATAPGAGQALLATWRQLIDKASLLDGDQALAQTARPAVALLSPATAAGLGLAEGEPVTVSVQHGSITLPVEFATMPDGVVWLPMNSPGARVGQTLGTGYAAVVTLASGAAASGAAASGAAASGAVSIGTGGVR